MEEAFSKIVEEYLGELPEKTKPAVSKAGRAVVNEIKGSNAFKDKSGKYRKGWRQKTEGDAIVGYVSTVYNSTRPGLAHLLEKGHGGPAPAPPHPHIAQAYEEGVKTLERELKKAIG